MYRIRPLSDDHWTALLSIWNDPERPADPERQRAVLETCNTILADWQSSEVPGAISPTPQDLRAMRANDLLEAILLRATQSAQTDIQNAAWDLALSGDLHGPAPAEFPAIHEWVSALLIGIESGAMPMTWNDVLVRVFSDPPHLPVERALSDVVRHWAMHANAEDMASPQSTNAQNTVVQAWIHLLSHPATGESVRLTWFTTTQKLLERMVRPGGNPEHAAALITIFDNLLDMHQAAPGVRFSWSANLEAVVCRALSQYRGPDPGFAARCQALAAHICARPTPLSQPAGAFCANVLNTMINTAALRAPDSALHPAPQSLDFVCDLWLQHKPAPSFIKTMLGQTDQSTGGSGMSAEVARVRATLWAQLSPDVLKENLLSALSSSAHQRAEEICVLLPEDDVASIYERHLDHLSQNTPLVRAAWEKVLIRRAVQEQQDLLSAGSDAKPESDDANRPRPKM